jgi:WD40 repeat protein
MLRLTATNVQAILDGMFRTGLVVSIFFCMLLPGSLHAQRSFPSPSTQLHDVAFKFTEPHPDRASTLRVVNGRLVGFPRTPTEINSLVFSHDGKLLAAGKQYGRLVVWDVASKQLVCTIDTGFNSVGRLAISPDSQFIAAAATAGRTITIWHIPDGRLANTFDNETANVLGLIYTPIPNLLLTFSAATNVYDTETGEVVRSFSDETFPVLSTDGNTLLTRTHSAIVLRSTRDWTIQKTLPLLTESETPAFLDSGNGQYLFEDISDGHVFVAARTSDGQMVPDARLANLPREQLGPGDFAATDPHANLVFGHSSGQLWVLNLKTGKTCLSEQLFSDSGAFSPDGTLLAGAIEPETPTDNQKKAGVDIWKTADLAKACHMQ